MNKYAHIQIKPETRRNLRLASALSDQSNIETLDEAVLSHLSKLMDVRKLTNFDLKNIKPSRR